MIARPAAAALLLGALSCTAPNPPSHAFFPFEKLRGQLFSAPQVLADARRENFGDEPNAIVLFIDESSSIRAVSDAVYRLRERNLAVGYWIDVRGAPGSSAAFDARLARARHMLENRPPADAIFLGGLQGDALPCGCRQAWCGVSNTVAATLPDTREGARLVVALRGFVGSSIVVPVWSDAAIASSDGCPDPKCAEARCLEHEAKAWNSLRVESDRLALQFPPAVPRNPAAYVTEELTRWSRLHPHEPALRSAPVASIIAVLPGLEWQSTDLAQVVAGVKSLGRAGILVNYWPVP